MRDAEGDNCAAVVLTEYCMCESVLDFEQNYLEIFFYLK